MKNFYLFFAPEALIWSYVSTNILLARLCAAEHTQPLLVRCTGQMFRCQSLNAARYPIEETEKAKAETCPKCIAQMDELLKQYALRHVDIANYVDEATIRSIRKKVIAIEQFDPDMEYRNVPVGRLAQTDISHDKISDYVAMTPSQLIRCRYSLAESMLAAEFMSNFLHTVHLDAVVTYNGYTSYATSRYVAFQKGIRSFVATHQVANGYDWRYITLLSSQRDKELLDHTHHKWSQVRDIPLSQEDVFNSLEDSAYRTISQDTVFHIHSSPTIVDPAIIMQQMALNPDKKLILAGTSSLDERYAANAERIVWNCTQAHDVMGSQVEWGESLLAFVGARPDLQLVIRVHPRDKDTSHHALLRSRWCHIPPNCRIVWPEEKISTYGLMELADVVLTSWSTLGLEAARLSIPAVQATTNLLFPCDVFMGGAATQDEYWDCVLCRMEEQPHLDKLKYALRFDLWNRRGHACDMGNFCQFFDDGFDRNFAIPQAVAPAVQSIIAGKLNSSEHNIRLKCAQPTPSPQEETKAIQTAVAWYLSILYFGNAARFCTALAYTPSLQHIRAMQKYTQRMPGVLGICFEGKKTVAFLNGALAQRTSAMVGRLTVMTGTPMADF